MGLLSLVALPFRFHKDSRSMEEKCSEAGLEKGFAEGRMHVWSSSLNMHTPITSLTTDVLVAPALSKALI